MAPRRTTPDLHVLYERAVQSVDADLDFLESVYRKRHRRSPLTFREDFCGTAAMATAFVRRGPRRRAWGIDLDAPTLDWGLTHHVARLPASARPRMTLIEGNVLSAWTPPVEAAVALNFSYQVFKTRATLRAYFEAVRRSLAPGGLFLIDAFGGTESMVEFEEKRKVPAGTTLEGDPVPPFTYIWQQRSFNVITHDIVCQIHFRLAGGRLVRAAFTYDWRLWTLPELRELMLEAGFARADVYLHGWMNDSGESDGLFVERTAFENAESWLAYVVGQNRGGRSHP